MKRTLFTMLLLAGFCSTAARAQVGIYGAFNATDFTNDGNRVSAWFGGPAFGAYYDFVHVGPVSAGVDVRGSYGYGSQNRFRSGLAGARIAGKIPVLGWRPYAQASIGIGGTRGTSSSFSTASNVSFSNTFSTKLLYAFYGGLDTSIVPHLDLRLFEVGYGRESAVSASPGTPSSSVLTVGSGVVLRF